MFGNYFKPWEILVYYIEGDEYGHYFANDLLKYVSLNEKEIY